MRAIASLAGSNVAAVGYHFGGKDELVTETLRRAIGRMTEERRAVLQSLPPDADLEAVVRAWLAPALRALRGEEGAGTTWRVLARTFQSPGPLLGALVAERGPDLEHVLLRRLAMLLPHLDPGELRWRHAATLSLAGLLGAGGGTVPATPGSDEAADRFVAYVLGALRAPSAGTGR